MDLSKFNCYTQYLKRDILLETLEAHRKFMEHERIDHQQHMLYAIVRNPNFDLSRYSDAFPNIDWGKYANPPPLSPREFALFSSKKYVDSAIRGAMLNRATEQQIHQIDAMGFDVIDRCAGTCLYLILFAGRPDITIHMAARLLQYTQLWLPMDCANILEEIASRRDLTPEIARQLCDSIPQWEVMNGRTSIVHMIYSRLARNSALSLDELYEIIGGRTPFIVCHQSFKPEHVFDDRFKEIHHHVCDMSTANCNFPLTEDQYPSNQWWQINPQCDAGIHMSTAEWEVPSTRMQLVQNDYNRNPQWRAL